MTDVVTSSRFRRRWRSSDVDSGHLLSRSLIDSARRSQFHCRRSTASEQFTSDFLRRLDMTLAVENSHVHDRWKRTRLALLKRRRLWCAVYIH